MKNKIKQYQKKDRIIEIDTMIQRAREEKRRLLEEIGKENKPIKKKFFIRRFAYILDKYDEGISAQEIESILNKFEERMGSNNLGFGKWEVIET